MRGTYRLLGMCVFMSSFVSTAFAQTSDRGWVDMNVVSSTPAQDGQTFAFQYSLFRETASLAAVYPKFPRATGALVGGGARIIGGLGVGIQITPVKYEYIVGLGIDIPHPAIFNRSASDGDVTASTLERTDNAIDISASYQIPTPDTWRVRVFGGPTYFAIKQDFVRDIEYAQQFNLLGLNVVDITGFEPETIDESAWGFHAGGDLAFFFSRHFGVGAGVRVNRGTLTIAREPMSEQAAEIKLGSVLFGGGLRVRF